MTTAVVLYAVTAWLRPDGYQHGDVTTGGIVFSLAGLVTLAAGGWLGGAIVFVHGVRVLAASNATEAVTTDALRTDMIER